MLNHNQAAAALPLMCRAQHSLLTLRLSRAAGRHQPCRLPSVQLALLALSQARGQAAHSAPAREARRRLRSVVVQVTLERLALDRISNLTLSALCSPAWAVTQLAAASACPPVTQWTPNPLARHSTTGGGANGSPAGEGGESPRQGLAGVLRLLEREGRVNQVGMAGCCLCETIGNSKGLNAALASKLWTLHQAALAHISCRACSHCHPPCTYCCLSYLQLEALKASVAQYETSAAELQATNHELAEALQQVRGRPAPWDRLCAGSGGIQRNCGDLLCSPLEPARLLTANPSCHCPPPSPIAAGAATCSGAGWSAG